MNQPPMSLMNPFRKPGMVGGPPLKADGDGGYNFPAVEPPMPGGGDAFGTPPGTMPSQPQQPGATGNDQGGFLNWLQGAGSSILGNIGGGISNALSNPALIPSLATAYNQWRDSDRYTTMAEGYADRLDPFGKERAGYQDRLRNAYDHPDQVLKDPAHQGIVDIQTDNIMRKLGAGGGSSSNMGVAMSDYLSKSDAQYLQQERQQLGQLAGGNIGPEASARMLQTGLQGSIDSRNNALDALMYPFGSRGNGQGGAGGAGGGGGGNNGGQGSRLPPGTPQTVRLPNGGSIPTQQILSRIQNSGMNPQTAAQLFRSILSSPEGLSPSTINMLESMGIDTNVDMGGADHAGFGQGGFGGYNDIDPSTQNILDDQLTNPDGSSIFGIGSGTIGGSVGGFGPTDPFSSGGFADPGGSVDWTMGSGLDGGGGDDFSSLFGGNWSWW